MKHCTTCAQLLPLAEYAPDRRATDGRQSRCKACSAAWLRAYRLRAGITKEARGTRTRNRSPEVRKAAKILSNRKWRARHKEHNQAYNRAWRAAHPEHVLSNRGRYAERKRHNGGEFTKAEFVALCQHYGNRCLCCGESKPLVADHVIPVSKGGASDISNIQPLCLSCNSKKHNKNTDYRQKGKGIVDEMVR